jgi:hypothetical protein
MKKLLVSTVLVAGLAATVYGQGIYVSDNANSTAGGTAATSGGVVWTNVNGHIGLWDGLDNNADLGMTILAGTSSSSLSVIATLYPAGGNTSGVDYGYFDFGSIIGGNQVLSLGGPAGQAMWIEIEAWQYELVTGSLSTVFNSYSAALLGGGLTGVTAPFLNNVSNPPGTPAYQLTGMPALILSVPEPGTFAIAGLGAALLLALRRRS